MISRRHFMRSAAFGLPILPLLVRRALGAAGGPADASAAPERLLARDTYPQYPGVALRALESTHLHCIHTYPGIDAYDRAGRRLLYVGFERPDSADIVIRSLDDGSERVVARTNSADYHTAAWQRWAFNDEAILFERRAANGTQETWLSPSDGRGRPEPVTLLSKYTLRHVIAHGHIAYAAQRATQDAPAHVARVDLAKRKKEVLFDSRPFVAAFEASERLPGGTTYYFSHPVPDAAEKWMFVKLMSQAPGEPASRFRAFFTFEIASGRVINHGSRISAHPIWDQVTGQILNIQGVAVRGESNLRRLVLMHPETQDLTEFAPEAIDGPGHPAVSPNGRWVVTDSFWRDNQAIIYLYDRASGARWRLSTLEHVWSGQQFYNPMLLNRGQPHPVWAPDSRSILINCNLGGTLMSFIS